MGLYQQFQKIAEYIAFALAMAGGLVLVFITVLNCISIIGRVFDPFDLTVAGFNIGSIREVYDITEICMATAVFAFLPWGHLREAHARVDLFQSIMPAKLDKSLDLLFNIAMAIFAIVLAYRLYLGMNDKLSYGETTFIAQIPVWQGYAAALIGAVGFVIIAIFCIMRSGRRLIHGEG